MAALLLSASVHKFTVSSFQRSGSLPQHQRQSSRGVFISRRRDHLNGYQISQGRSFRVMASGESEDKPSPWRFLRWGQSNNKPISVVDKENEERPKGNFVYKLKPGEDLFDIALRYNTDVNVLMEANQMLNPDNVAAGQLLWVPFTYKIKKGDTLYSISRKFGVKVDALAAANGIEDKNLIFAGDILVIPDEASSDSVGMVE